MGFDIVSFQLVFGSETMVLFAGDARVAKLRAEMMVVVDRVIKPALPTFSRRRDESA